VKIEAFIIHLARATQRRPQVERIIAACPLKTHIIDAVDGQAMDDASRAAVYRKGLFTPRYPFELTPGEIGGFLSHRRAWQEIMSRGLDAGFIIEDDIEVDAPVFAAALAFAASRIAEDGYTQFQVRTIAEPGASLASADGVTIARPAVTLLGATSQLISREAAGWLLRVSETFDRPVDALMQMHWLTGIQARLAIPSGVREISAEIGGTTIQKKSRTFCDRLHHEVMRPLYLARIARLSRKHDGRGAGMLR